MEVRDSNHDTIIIYKRPTSSVAVVRIYYIDYDAIQAPRAAYVRVKVANLVGYKSVWSIYISCLWVLGTLHINTSLVLSVIFIPEPEYLIICINKRKKFGSFSRDELALRKLSSAISIAL